MTGRLTGHTIVVTRSGEQAGALTDRLLAEGATVLEVPTIEIADPPDGGRALHRAMRQQGRYDWVVVTSPNGARRVADALDGGALSAPLIAAVGPGTAAALAERGLAVSLVPAGALAEALVASFPSPEGQGRVLVAQAERARTVLAEGLRAKGWTVDVVAAYRTVPVAVPAALAERAARADAITFASGSAVEAYLAGAGRSALPAKVVVIGPITRAAVEGAGLAVAAEADPHTLDGLVEATVEALS